MFRSPHLPLLALVALATTLTACVSEVGSGDPATEEREIAGATAVVNTHFVQASIFVDADAPSMTLTCDDNLLEHLITEVEDDGRLVLRTESGLQLLPRAECTAEIHLARLDAVEGSGSGDTRVETDGPDLARVGNSGSGSVEVQGTAGALTEVISSGSGPVEIAVAEGPRECTLSVLHTGSGRVELQRLQACSLDVESHGSGSTVLSGDAERATIQVSGSGGVKDQDLVVDEAELVLSGSGRVEITVLEALSARLSGSGGATVHGQPEQRDVSETGSGRVRFE